MGLHVLALLDIAGRMTDRIAVFDYILTAFYIANGVFMSVGKIYLYVIKLIY